jgi:Ca2+-binding EF-hand superfamily protein
MFLDNQIDITETNPIFSMLDKEKKGYLDFS